MSYRFQVVVNANAAGATWSDLSVAEAAALIASDPTFAIAIGNIILANLPTSNPHVNGSLWNNNGVLMVSTG